MKSLKIYGIHGLLEWHGIIHSNGVQMRVDFTNGSTTAYGVAPATYQTKDELTQRIIENSDEFKSGRIRLVRKIELPDDTPRDFLNTDAAVKTYPDITKTQEAKDILQKEYNYNVASIRSKADVHTAAKELNIAFPNLQ